MTQKHSESLMGLFNAWSSCKRFVHKTLIITVLRCFQYHTLSQGHFLLQIFQKHFINHPHVPSAVLSTEWAQLLRGSTKSVGETLFCRLSEIVRLESTVVGRRDPRISKGKETDRKFSCKLLHIKPT